MRPRLCSSHTVLQHPLIVTSRILMISHPHHGPSSALLNRSLTPTETLARKASSPSPVYLDSDPIPVHLALLAGPALYVPLTSEQAQVSLTSPPRRPPPHVFAFSFSLTNCNAFASPPLKPTLFPPVSSPPSCGVLPAPGLSMRLVRNVVACSPCIR